jgi:kynurenine formamidase
VAKESWGRWGPDDEKGAVNWISPSRVARAAKSVTSGRVISLTVPIGPQTPVASHRLPPKRFMDRAGGDSRSSHRRTGRFQFAEDTLLLATHTGTHVDALAHVWYEDALYNGFPSSEISGSTGAKRCGIEKMGPLVGRGIVLDVVRWIERLRPGRAVTSDHLRACLSAEALDIQEGDIVFIRTGWIAKAANSATYFAGEPGLDVEAASWLATQRVAVIGADNYAVEVQPSSEDRFPVHQILLRDYGVPLIENLNLEPLASAGIVSFLVVAAPLPIEGATASPVNVIAIV